VLAGSAAYAVSEAFGWTEGLDRKPREAKAFYGVIAAATLGGVALNFIGIDPMQALYWAAVVNGLLAPPLMVVTMLIARNAAAMGGMPISRGLAVGGWLATSVMAGVAALFLLL
jgi:Mn2+/Fe2+ NRAMP family transporter